MFLIFLFNVIVITAREINKKKNNLIFSLINAKIINNKSRHVEFS